MTDNQSIKVSFIQDTPKDSFEYLGHISPNDAIKIITAIGSGNAPTPICTGPISADFIYLTATPYMRPFHHGELKLNQLFTKTTEYMSADAYHMPCALDCKNASPDARTKICAKNLAAGKCLDKFMRETIGTVLYPHHYAAQKVK